MFKRDRLVNLHECVDPLNCFKQSRRTWFRPTTGPSHETCSFGFRLSSDLTSDLIGSFGLVEMKSNWINGFHFHFRLLYCMSICVPMMLFG